MEIVLLLIRLILFAVFALAAIGKFLDLKGSEKAVKDFGAPDELVKPLAIALPFAEIIFACCFLFVSTSWVGAIGALVLLGSFTIGMIYQLSLGNAPDCHCFGQIHSEPVSVKTLIRNIIFVLLAFVLVARGRDNQGISLTDTGSSTMELILIFLLMALVVAGLVYLKRVLDAQSEILRRIELLELLSRDGVPLERHEAGSPHDGLPIGAPFPNFALPDVSGRTINLSKVLEDGRPAIFFFVSSTCDPCKALLPEIESWDAELGNRINFVFFSSGTAKDNAGKFAVFSDDVILQKDRELAEQVYARWTPTAIFVRSDGTIGSHPSAGDAAIRDLVGKLRSADLHAENVHFIGHRHNGLRDSFIGRKVPEFALEDHAGKLIDTDNLRGQKTLAVFWSPTCPHCGAMMEDLKAWDGSRAESDPQLIVFSDGQREEHSQLGLRAPIVIDADYKTSEQLGMFGTPSAVMVDEDGTIVSETAMGASNIWALLGRRPGNS